MAKKKDGTPRTSSTGGPGPRHVDMTNWRQKLQERRLKFDDHAKQVFLEHFSYDGLFGKACRMAGVAMSTVGDHIKNDPEFEEMYYEAKDAYKDRVIDHAENLIFNGVEEPIIGGKNKDQVVAHKLVYPTNLIAMEMKKVDPEYKERSEVDVKGGGGVLIAPNAVTPEEWLREQQAKNEEKPKPGEDEDKPADG